ncbi:hypothetical protein KIL84_022755 [Mauremys mutica]|uniref:Uncharacterized protein n=1 Tax=Mauremys mutica TaxID=74926 RepID=A0A9D4AQX0_9SAUR|nr:hypothetical protein KIL84_022755 [Mauremys mutica]
MEINFFAYRKEKKKAVVGPSGLKEMKCICVSVHNAIGDVCNSTQSQLNATVLHRKVCKRLGGKEA